MVLCKNTAFMLGNLVPRHALLRPMLRKRRLESAQELQNLTGRCLVSCWSIVTLLQQPQTAKNVTFVSLEDETGQSERQRPALLQSRLLAVQGRWQRDGDVCNAMATRLVDLTPLLGQLAEATNKSRDFTRASRN